METDLLVVWIVKTCDMLLGFRTCFSIFLTNSMNHSVSIFNQPVIGNICNPFLLDSAFFHFPEVVSSI